MNALTGTRGASRKSPVEIFADAASVVTRSPYAEVTGLKHGKLGRWTDAWPRCVPPAPSSPATGTRTTKSC